MIYLIKRIKVFWLLGALALVGLVVIQPWFWVKQSQVAQVTDQPYPPLFTLKDAPVLPKKDLAETVNTLIGTDKLTTLPGSYGSGETFPGADYPFGMVQWSPDTVQPTSTGYSYRANQITGFSLTHLSGAGCSVYGDIPFMPYTGAATTALTADLSQNAITFAHPDEIAHAGYYQVSLANGVTTELTVTQHSGVARFIYPPGQTAVLLVKVADSLHHTSTAQATLGRDTIAGWVSNGDFCGTHHNTYRLYFWAQCSQPFASFGTWHTGSLTFNQHETTSADTAAFVTFDTRPHNVVTVRVGLSFVSVANAEANVNQEDPHGNFTATQQQARAAWNTWLNKIQVSGGTPDQTSTFYTALYHVLLFPSVFSDVNGQYIGFDGHVYTVPPGHAQYANFSGWDVYRSEAQLLALLAPNQASDMAQSLLNDYTQSGGLPKWSLANGETYVQVGDPADPIIADIYAFGGTQFDAHAALAAMIKQATQPNVERPGLQYLEQLGYEPQDGTYSCCNAYGQAATTLEYNTADFAIGALARALGDEAEAQKFIQRAQDWRNLFNPATGYLEPRNRDGSFPIAYDLTKDTGWVEGNSIQYTWMVPFNLHGLFAALGGNANVIARLNTFFTQLNAGPESPYAFLGNEPTLETPWEYDYAGAPYKTQQVVRRALNTLYAPDPIGLPGNDDLGEMSSWYIFAALGMYPETPGSANLVLASPLFSHITLYRSSGQVIQINAPGASASVYYVQQLRVNGQLSTRPWLDPSFIANGGTLDYTLASTPNVAWGAAPGDAPPSYQ